MITEVSIRNYQSLRYVQLQLGRFTVITGHTDSGKSAVMRALRMLISNARGSSFVAHGEKLASVSAKNDNGTITLMRGEGTGEYRITDGISGETKAYTKLGGAVPEDVTRFLGIEPADPINFAGQHDAPFLIGLPASQVAKVLGELTNVHKIYNAANEGKRQASQASSKLKIREQDLAQITDDIQKYATLPERLAAQEEAETWLRQAETLDSRLTILGALLRDLQIATDAVARLEQVYPAPVTAEAIDTAWSKQLEYTKLLSALSTAQNAVTQHEATMQQLESQEASLHEQLHNLLTEAGVCPTCGQSTRELTSV